MKNSVFEEYRDKHKGERVFLIGNGPSLASTDLDLIKGEYSIAMNRISLIYNKYKVWRPTYYIFTSTNVKDSCWGGAWARSVREAVDEPKTTSFIAKMFKEYIDPRDECPQIKWFESVSENKPLPDGTIHPDSFSLDAVKRLDKSGTTMNMALQIAYFMGFSEIVFLGVDLGWVKDEGTTSDPNHFDRSYRANIPNPYKANWQMRNVHKMAQEVFFRNRKDVRMFNASARTVLDVYPIIDFKAYVEAGEVKIRESEQSLAKEYWINLKDELKVLKFLKKSKQLPIRIFRKMVKALRVAL